MHQHLAVTVNQPTLFNISLVVGNITFAAGRIAEMVFFDFVIFKFLFGFVFIMQFSFTAQKHFNFCHQLSTFWIYLCMYGYSTMAVGILRLVGVAAQLSIA